ncbi:hypothetical protein [Paraburkholderia silvatlantica]|uniref:Uncharacterized protein n=1 Tax=Paraburkholderia silvatlantica TaxID=321895 RepID=A0ABR6FZY6_9BURK|nr:hypothetical protein [Paraburkholderia silvatlantica]MBB2932593.1 hypothetical protein [Paraburkholderia silvatlantica]PVY22276.1 hypothetical protein C7411_13369 [Paraburkholderia silvatlantica]PXW27083.1 hypothetical protein C7413_13469 [Paraburkholderia silvatlantica]
MAIALEPKRYRIRLRYVAVTRAQHVLDITELRDELLRLFSLRRQDWPV